MGTRFRKELRKIMAKNYSKNEMFEAIDELHCNEEPIKPPKKEVCLHDLVLMGHHMVCRKAGCNYRFLVS